MKLIVALISLISFFSPTKKIEFTTVNKSTITVKGTSTLHDWQMVAENIDAKAVIYATDTAFQVESFTGIVKVTDLKSGTNAMDKNAYKTLKSDKFPEIKFNLVKVIDMNKEDQRITAIFNVEVSGTNKELEITANTNPIGDDQVQLTGTTRFKMTDFGIPAPSFMLGTLKVGNDLTIEFNLQMQTTTPSVSHVK